MQHCYLDFCLALGSPNTSMTTLLRTTLDLTMNKSKALCLVFINLFLNEGHTAQKKKKKKNHCNLHVMANSSGEELGRAQRENMPLQ